MNKDNAQNICDAVIRLKFAIQDSTHDKRYSLRSIEVDEELTRLLSGHIDYITHSVRAEMIKGKLTNLTIAGVQVHGKQVSLAETNEREKTEFLEAAKPLIKWLNENGCPHDQVIVDPVGAEFVRGSMMVTTQEFLKD